MVETIADRIIAAMSNFDTAIAFPNREFGEEARGGNVRFILASGSKRRIDIMALTGLTFIALDGSGGDSEITSQIEPDVYKLTRQNAETKLHAAVAAAKNRIPWDTVVIAADTVVALDGDALGKPGDRDEAVDMLRKLRGRQHQVVTTVALTYAPHRQRGESLAHTVITKVNMRNYDNFEIHDYVATGLPYDRAGAYGVQDSEFNPAETVIGCYLNVVGLPLCAMRCMLPPGVYSLANSHIYATCAAHEEMNAS